MKKVLLIIALMLFIPLNTNAKEIKLEWEKLWGGSESDSFDKVIETKDGNIVVVGNYYSTDIDGFDNQGKSDSLIIKFDKDMNVIWKQTWGKNSIDQFTDVIEAEDGSFIVIGNTHTENVEINSENDNINNVIVKYDALGNLVWEKIWGGNDLDNIRNIENYDNNSFIIYGESKSTDLSGIENKGGTDSIIAKYDYNGNLIWQKGWGGNKTDGFSDMVIMNDGTITVVGTSSSTNIENFENQGEYDGIIIKYSSDGEQLSQTTWGGNGLDYFTYASLTKDNGLLVLGRHNSTNIEGHENRGAYDILLINFDENNNLVWKQTLGGNNYETESGVKITNKNEIIVFLSIMSTDFEYNGENIKGPVLVKYNMNGEMLSIEKFFHQYTYGISNKIINDGNIYIFETRYSYENGVSNNDINISKYRYKYILAKKETINGTLGVIQQGLKGKINPTPENGYKVDKVIVKDTQGNEIETKLNQDGTYSFDLYDDVTVEVLFALAVDNPKTGILNYGFIVVLFMIIPILGILCISRYNQKYGL